MIVCLYTLIVILWRLLTLKKRKTGKYGCRSEEETEVGGHSSNGKKSEICPIETDNYISVTRLRSVYSTKEANGVKKIGIYTRTI